MNFADRIKILELSKPAVTYPDVELWLLRAEKLETWVTRGGPSVTDPPKPIPTRAPEDRRPPPSQGPARK